MEFKEAFKALKQGERIKRKAWSGYWEMARDVYSPTAKNTIFMHCKTGEVLDIRHTDDVFFTVGNMTESDWEVVGTEPECDRSC